MPGKRRRSRRPTLVYSEEGAAVAGSVTDIAIRTEALEGGEHKLVVRAFDAAGNEADDSVSVTVEEKATEPDESETTAETVTVTPEDESESDE